MRMAIVQWLRPQAGEVFIVLPELMVIGGDSITIGYLLFDGYFPVDGS